MLNNTKINNYFYHNLPNTHSVIENSASHVWVVVSCCLIIANEVEVSLSHTNRTTNSCTKQCGCQCTIRNLFQQTNQYKNEIKQKMAAPKKNDSLSIH